MSLLEKPADLLSFLLKIIGIFFYTDGDIHVGYDVSE